MSKPKGVGRYERIDITGERYGRLVAIEYVGRNEKNNSISLWKYKCDCGNEVVLPMSAVRSGNTKSCGCYKRDKSIKHNMTGTKLYRVWKGMRDRCNKENSCNYFRYGARGIRVCEEWQGDNGFQNFYDWSMENGYKNGLWIDRIDNNGNYEPSNCKWSTPKEQGNNRRVTVYYTIDGVSKTASQWSEISGVRPSVIRSRIYRGWDVKKAVFQKVGRYKRKNETTHNSNRE